ncbi:MAG: hypothetical protein ACRDQW_08790 [Haloechinothrix sp.]
MDTDDYYDGMLVVDLPVTDIDVPDPAHLRRSVRYPGALDIDPAAAIEAGHDPHGSSRATHDQRPARSSASWATRQAPTGCWSSC